MIAVAGAVALLSIWSCWGACAGSKLSGSIDGEEERGMHDRKIGMQQACEPPTCGVLHFLKHDSPRVYVSTIYPSPFGECDEQHISSLGALEGARCCAHCQAIEGIHWIVNTPKWERGCVSGAGGKWNWVVTWIWTWV
jgi:hypothetical protein